jgi:hypothetical protein
MLGCVVLFLKSAKQRVQKSNRMGPDCVLKEGWNLDHWPDGGGVELGVVSPLFGSVFSKESLGRPYMAGLERRSSLEEFPEGGGVRERVEGVKGGVKAMGLTRPISEKGPPEQKYPDFVRRSRRFAMLSQAGRRLSFALRRMASRL